MIWLDFCVAQASLTPPALLTIARTFRTNSESLVGSHAANEGEEQTAEVVVVVDNQ